MAKKHKILGAIAGLVGVAVIATGVYFAVPKIVNKSWGEILHIGEEKPPAEKSKLTLSTNGNLTFICADDKGTTYTEEELEAKEWQGDTLTFTLAPNDGYMLWSVKVNGEEITLDNNMFTVTIDKDTTIDVEVQEIKEYTANIVEDRYSQWQLTVNGEPLNDGDTIHTGDLISGRVISLTSGYKTGTFLVNDVEYVHLLDKYGFIQQPIRVENSELSTVRFATSTVRDVSSLYVPFDSSIDRKSLISSPTFAYTSETCSVYNITGYGLRVGEEVKMDFIITNTEYFGGITLNGEPLEVTTQEDGVTASCTFIVPENECTLEVVAEELEEEPVVITFEYDEEDFHLTNSFGNGVYDALSKTLTFYPGTIDYTASLDASPTDLDFYLTKNIVVELVYENGGSEKLTYDKLEPENTLPIWIDYGLTNVNDSHLSSVKVYFEDKVAKSVTLDYDKSLIRIVGCYTTIGNADFDAETDSINLYGYDVFGYLKIEVLEPTIFDTHDLVVKNGKMMATISSYERFEELLSDNSFGPLRFSNNVTYISMLFEEKEVEEPAFEAYTITFDVDSDLTVRKVDTWEIINGTLTVTEQPITAEFEITVTTLGSHEYEELVVKIDNVEHVREVFVSGQSYTFNIPYACETVSIHFEEIIETSTFSIGSVYNFKNYGTIDVIDDGTETLVSFVDGVVTYDINKTGKVILKVTVNDPSYFDEHGFAIWYGSTKIPVFDYQTEYTFELDPKEIEAISYMDVVVVACGKYIVNYDEEIFTVAGGNSYEEHYGHSDDNHTFLNSELESSHNIYIISLIDPSLLDTNNVIVTCDSEQRTLTKEDFSSGSYEVLGAYKEITITLQPIV